MSSQAAVAVFASEDLIRHIYSFGSPDHRQHMRILGKEIRHETVSRYGKELLTRVPYLYFKRSAQKFREEEVLKELKWFYRLNRCMCCSRHTHRKPSIIHDGKGFMYLGPDLLNEVPEQKDLRDCQCRCRQNMRLLLHHFHSVREL
jgi:hypothetical protein